MPSWRDFGALQRVAHLPPAQVRILAPVRSRTHDRVDGNDDETEYDYAGAPRPNGLPADPPLRLVLLAGVLTATAVCTRIRHRYGRARGLRLRGANCGPDAPTPGDLAYERLATAGLRDDIHRIMIPGIQHVGISDFPEILGAPGTGPLLGEAGITAKFTAIQNDLVLGFLDRYVKGIDSDYPTGALARYPELMVRNRDDIRRQAEALGMGPHSYGWDALGMPVLR